MTPGACSLTESNIADLQHMEPVMPRTRSRASALSPDRYYVLQRGRPGKHEYVTGVFQKMLLYTDDRSGAHALLGSVLNESTGWQGRWQAVPASEVLETIAD
jgi:hypothetical protein